MKKIRNKTILLILCFSMLSGTMSLGFARAELAPATSPIYSATIVVFDQVLSDWPHPAETTLEIPSYWQVTAVTLKYRAHKDPDDYYLRAMSFRLDGRGGGIGCERIGRHDIWGWTISGGETKYREFNMNHVLFPRDWPDMGGDYWTFITGSESFLPGYFSPGVHDIQAFVSTQYPGAVQESWVSITLEITYTLRIIPAEVEFNPETLNRKSQGNWVTVYIDLPDGFNEEDINISTIKLNGVVDAEIKPTGIDEDGILMVKFDREAVQALLETGENVEISISGYLFDGMEFGGTDTLSVIH